MTARKRYRYLHKLVKNIRSLEFPFNDNMQTHQTQIDVIASQIVSEFDPKVALVIMTVIMSVIVISLKIRLLFVQNRYEFRNNDIEELNYE